MTNRFGDAIDQRLRDLISELSDGATTVTRWLVIYEVSDGNGRVVLSSASDSATLQDLAGMLHYVGREVDNAIDMVIDHQRGNT